MAWFDVSSPMTLAFLVGVVIMLCWTFLCFALRRVLRPNADRSAIEKEQGEGEENYDVGTYIPPRPDDSRAPCPALNTMANHGYLPRSGRNITGPMIVSALQRAYNLSLPLARLLTYGGLLLLGRLSGPISLSDTALHGRIEHNASLIHRDTHAGCPYAPTDVDEELWDRFTKAIERPREGLSVRDLARFRVLREYESECVVKTEGGTGTTHVGREIARGELALVFHIFGREFPSSSIVPEDPDVCETSQNALLERKVPLDILKTFMHDERLPDGWVPSKQTTLLETVKKAREIRLTMGDVRKREKVVKVVDC